MNTLVGLTFAPEVYDYHLSAYRDIATCRVFSPTDTLPAWDDPRVQKLTTAGIIPYLSVKGFNPTAFKASLDSRPHDIPMVFLAHDHEPENDPPGTPSPIAWDSRQKALYEMVASHPDRAHFKFVTPLTKQWTENTPGRSYFSHYSGHTDAVAVDCYVNSWGAPAYPQPKLWLARVLDFAARVGRPLWIPELGASTRPGDTNDTGRADWLAGVLAELDASALCELVAWWCARDQQTGHSFHLTAATGRVWQDHQTRHKAPV